MKRMHFILLLLLSSCAAIPEQQRPDATHIAFPELTEKDTGGNYMEVVDVFVDSLNIGEKGKSKVEIVKHRVYDDIYIALKFYTAKATGWKLENSYQYECNTSNGLEPFIGDFNNDHKNDITFISATAARGSNEVRRLFIYDVLRQQLFPIVNAEDYPNMQYNGTLNCIDAFLVYGGTSTVFAHIEGDSLKTFAGVDNDNYRTVYEIDDSGKERIISKDTITDLEDIYIRYKNYKPLEAYGPP